MTDSNGRFGFDRSGVHRSVCEEMASLARLKMEDALLQMYQGDNEVAFGALITDERIEFTGFYEGDGASIGQMEVFNLHNEMMAIDPSGEGRMECLIHTHPTRPVASLTDFRVILSSMTPGDSSLMDRYIPPFDHFYIIAKVGYNKGAIKGYKIDEMPPDKVYARYAQRFKEDYDTIKERDKDGKVKYMEMMLDELSEYVSTCRETFEMKQIGPDGVR